jgi:hypothetical protein
LDGKTGIFPVTYCEEIETKEALSRLSQRRISLSPPSLSTLSFGSLPSLDPTLPTLENAGMIDDYNQGEEYDEAEFGQVDEGEEDEYAGLDAEELKNMLKKEKALRMALQNLLSERGDYPLPADSQ